MAKRKPKFDIGKMESALSKGPVSPIGTTVSDAGSKFSPKEHVTASDRMKKLASLENDNKSTAFQFVLLPKDSIRRNEKNDFPIVEIERLEQSILTFGLLEQLTVYFDEKEEIYVLESGERRFRAICNLIDRFRDMAPNDSADYKNYKEHVEPFDLNGIPCKVETNTDPLYSEARLIIANIEKRPEDPLFKAKKTTELAELYKKINEKLPPNERISINLQLQEDLGLGPRQVIRNKQFGGLDPSLQDALISTVGVNEGAKFHKLTTEEQQFLAKEIEEKGSVPDVETAKKMYHNQTTTEENDKDNGQIDSSNEKKAALSLAAEIKSVSKNLKKNIDKLNRALPDYSKIDPELLKLLNLEQVDVLRQELLKAVHSLDV